MKTIAVTINKGGAGKTMISRSLATAAARSGLAVLIVDMDTQQNSTNWRRRRSLEEALPLVQFTTENDLEETLRRAHAADCDLVIIDTPPGRSTEAPAAVEASDLVLVPCTPEVESFEGLPRTARLARTTGKTAVVVPNLVQPTSRSEEEAIRGVAEVHGLRTVPVAFTASTCTEKGACAVAPPRSFSPTARLQRRLTPYGAGFVPSCS
jgi:chromosome partitioning protein